MSLPLYVAAEPELQPVDLERRERETGERLTSRAIAYWLDQYAGLPVSMFSPTGPAESPRYQKPQQDASDQGRLGHDVLNFGASPRAMLVIASCERRSSWAPSRSIR